MSDYPMPPANASAEYLISYWKGHPAIQEEFNNNFAQFVAYVENQDKVYFAKSGQGLIRATGPSQ